MQHIYGTDGDNISIPVVELIKTKRCCSQCARRIVVIWKRKQFGI